jgi:hypothetical protein
VWEREFVTEGIDRERAERLYFDSTVQVALAEGTGGMRWIEPRDRKRAWEDELRYRAFDPAWKPPKSAPGMLPYEVIEFSDGDERLILFFDFD